VLLLSYRFVASRRRELGYITSVELWYAGGGAAMKRQVLAQLRHWIMVLGIEPVRLGGPKPRSGHRLPQSHVRRGDCYPP